MAVEKSIDLTATGPTVDSAIAEAVGRATLTLSGVSSFEVERIEGLVSDEGSLSRSRNGTTSRPLTGNRHRRREPAPGVFRLVLPLPWPGLGDVNAYLLAGRDGATLVDCGMHLPDDEAGDHGWAHLVDALSACDHRPSDIARLVVTHAHIDHFGLAGRLKEEAGCEILMHANALEELEVFEHPDVIAAQLRDTYKDHGIKGEELEELTRFEDWRRYVHSNVRADTWLSGEESLEIGSRSLRVVHTPGHTGSHVCHFDE
jgi:glyoxylase-like metal-dependent hydrolase (beta-lactamase superfamily II)/flavin-binding protein dodecin